MIDTHAHPLLCKRPITEWIDNARLAGLTHVVCVSTTVQMGLDSLALSQQYPQIIPTIGIHPCEAAHPDRLDEIEALVKQHPFKAIGEIGLDFYRDNAPYEQQVTVFETQLKIAQAHHLPVIIHSRHADKEIIPLINKYPDVTKVIHCFSSDLNFVEQVQSSITYFSFTGMVTYPNKQAILEVIAGIPLDKMMIETDCPYLTPSMHKGEEYQPDFVIEIAKKIAQAKHCSVEAVLETTTQTARNFFKIK